MKPTPSPHKRPRSYQKHGDCRRETALRKRGIDAIDGRSPSGRIAKRWRRNALDRKGGKDCPYHVRVEIDAATFDLWVPADLAARAVISLETTRRRQVRQRIISPMPFLLTI